MLSGVLDAADRVLEVTKGFVLDYGKMTAVTNPNRGLCWTSQPCQRTGGTVKWIQRLLIPDFFYAHTDQVVLNYGTVGYYLARLAFWSGSPWYESENDSRDTASPVARNLTALTRCLVAYVKNISGLELSVEEPWWREVVQTRWAAEVSFRAAAFRDANIGRQRSLKQLFFLRFGHTFCAMPSHGKVNVAATACRVATMTLSAFVGGLQVSRSGGPDVLTNLLTACHLKVEEETTFFSRRHDEEYLQDAIRFLGRRDASDRKPTEKR
ncbi:hypothetical protein MRX96_056843 [Rhipicephalus microplus]